MPSDYNVRINNQYMQDIADAIRAKSGTSEAFLPAEMASAIEEIPAGGEPTTISFTDLMMGSAVGIVIFNGVSNIASGTFFNMEPNYDICIPGTESGVTIGRNAFYDTIGTVFLGVDVLAYDETDDIYTVRNHGKILSLPTGITPREALYVGRIDELASNAFSSLINIHTQSYWEFQDEDAGIYVDVPVLDVGIVGDSALRSFGYYSNFEGYFMYALMNTSYIGASQYPFESDYYTTRLRMILPDPYVVSAASNIFDSSVSSDAFDIAVYVPSSLYDDYIADTTWANFSSWIKSIPDDSYPSWWSQN